MNDRSEDMPSRVAAPFVFLAKLLAWDREAWSLLWRTIAPQVKAAERGISVQPPLPHVVGKPIPPENIVYREGREIPRPPPPPRPSEDLNPTVRVRC